MNLKNKNIFPFTTATIAPTANSDAKAVYPIPYAATVACLEFKQFPLEFSSPLLWH
jgi:hypothetical protein